MRHIALIAACFLGGTANAESKNPNIEMAARMNVAENLCDVNFGDRRGVVHFVMLGAADMNVSLDYASGLADARHREIVSYLNRNRKLDDFCQNARSGKI